MLSFVSEFPVERTRTATDFLDGVRTWLLGSPHTAFEAGDLDALGSATECRVTKGAESLEALRAESTTEETQGVRHIIRDDGLEWVTTVVFSRTGFDSWIGIRTSCESHHPAVRLPAAKKPILVRVLLERLGGSSDGMLRVGSSPTRLENADIEIAADLIGGRMECRLPIIYVSAGFQGGHSLDVDRLAADMAGMAHVIVEPNRAFSVRLKLEVNSENVYGGTVGVYWPDAGGRRSFFTRAGFGYQADLYRAIFEEVRTALTNRRALDRCTWAYLQESASRHTIEGLKSSGSQELDKYVETFDIELTAKEQRLAEAEKEIARLRNELRIYEARLAAGTGSLLQAGTEQDLYPHEVSRVVRDALSEARDRVPTDSRRQHVLHAILAANPAGEDVAGRLRAELKELLRASRDLDARTRRGLEDMGFAITDDGKHYKLVFQGDDRYTFTLAKSGGDHRGGLNAASDISRLLF